MTLRAPRRDRVATGMKKVPPGHLDALQTVEGWYCQEAKQYLHIRVIFAATSIRTLSRCFIQNVILIFLKKRLARKWIRKWISLHLTIVCILPPSCSNDLQTRSDILRRVYNTSWNYFNFCSDVFWKALVLCDVLWILGFQPSFAH